MLCSHLCGRRLRRPHFTCLTCRKRRWNQNRRDRDKWTRGHVQISFVEEPDGSNIIPRKATVYVLVVDGNRRFARLKDLLLAKLRVLEEFLSN